MTSPSVIELSVIAPAHNECENLPILVREIHAALGPIGLRYEVLIVDDGSTDETPRLLEDLMVEDRRLRSIRMMNTPPGRGHGQSAAFHAGFRASRGQLIAVLDADCQNDPADLPAMLRLMQSTGAHMVQGDRSRVRADNLIRKAGSLVGRVFRRLILGDTIRDTGCSLRLMHREVALAIPLEFRGMHRFIPVTARHLRYTVVEMPVSHRARTLGETKYGLGIWSRALPGLLDCLAVRWMRHRRKPVGFEHTERAIPLIHASSSSQLQEESHERPQPQTAGSPP